jgi:thermostable 8-oxoguanine DNA glycosylase
MANVHLINVSFMKKWQKMFDSSARDHEAYDQLVLCVKNDIAKHGCITKPTFIRLINWKSPRIRPIFEKRDFAEYEAGIKKCLAADDNEKMAILDELYGIGAPVASTILHFTYPDQFPIIDVRTAEALCRLGYIESSKVSTKRYTAFRDAILCIQKQHPRYTLRQIDMALFAFDKYYSGGE